MFWEESRMDEPGAIWIPTANMWSNRYGHTPTYIILHGTGSQGSPTAQNIANYFATPAAGVSANYVIGRDGVIVQCVAEHDAAWGNGVITAGADSWWSINPNLITISIEHVNDVTNGLALTDVQQAASFMLIKHICQRWAIAPRKADATGGITGHFSIDPVNRADCPGTYPWDALFSFLGAHSMLDIGNPAVANYFKLVGTNRWQCKKTTFFIGGDILSFYQNVGNVGLNGITLLGLPLTNEERVLDSVGHPVTDHQGRIATRQRFERGEITYDPSHLLDSPPGAANCYMSHIDALYTQASTAAAYEKQATNLQQTLTETSKQLVVLQQQRDAATAHATALAKELSALQSGQAKITSTEVLSYLEELLKSTASVVPAEFTGN